MGIPNNEWLYWCRLCARDDAQIKVRNNALDRDMVSMISKCFDVEMTLEEPELGSMLCEECFSAIRQLVTFSESVDKVQSIFELLRHSEPLEDLDVEALRREYGLSSSSKSKHKRERELETSDDQDEDDFDAFREPPCPVSYDTEVKEEEFTWEVPAFSEREVDEEVKYAVEEEEEYANVKAEDSKSLQPAKPKRGRPKGSGKQRRKLANKKPQCIVKTDMEDASIHSSPEAPGGSFIRNRYVCIVCNESFISSVALRSHKHDMHGGPKRFVCDCCGKGLKTLNLLLEHKLVHTDAKPCVCPVCGAGFKNKARLRVHLETHGEPRFKCNVCGKKLQTRANLNKHKFVHNDERPFKCEICGAGCKNSTALKVHLLSHTGLRPYVCKYCGKAFASNTNCRSHKWKKHPSEVAVEDEKESSRIPVPTLEELRAITREMAKSKKDES